MKQKQTLLIVFLLLFGASLFVPQTSVEAAGLVPCGGRGEDPCTLCHFIVGIHGIIDWFMRVMVIAALAIITAMGVLYIVSGGNEGLTRTAKKGLAFALAGILIVLFAWLVVNVTMFRILPTKDNLGVGAEFRLSSGFSFECSTTSTANTSGTSTSSSSSSSNNSGATSTIARCQPLTSGVCSVANLRDEFGDNAERMSRICNYESGGNATTASLSDTCTDGNSFSIGLFQVNLTVHDMDRGCTGAFSGRNYSCTVTNSTLYDSCVSIAENPQTNIDLAASISNNGANITPWRNTVNTCGIQ